MKEKDNTQILKISAHGFDLTDAIRDKAHERFAKVLDHDENIDNLDVTLEVGSRFAEHKIKTFVAKANLNFHKHHIHAEYEASDLYLAMKELEQRLLREVRKEHRKFQSKRKEK
jgi:ribosomal subunit interface protein